MHSTIWSSHRCDRSTIHASRVESGMFIPHNLYFPVHSYDTIWPKTSILDPVSPQTCKKPEGKRPFESE